MPCFSVLRGSVGSVRHGVALAIALGVASSIGLAQQQTAFLQLKPRQPQTLLVSLEKNQMARVQLHLHGGIVGVRETAPDGSSRPLWLIDLGRDATLTYVVEGSGAGNPTLEITSFEKQRLAEISLEIDQPSSSNTTLTNLRDAEDLVANAELIRRHWPSAPAGKDALQLYDRALALAATTDANLPFERLILTQKARYLIFGQERFTLANTLLEQAVALPATNDVAQQALAWKTLSTVRYDLGAYEAAIQAGIAALDLYRQTNDLYWQGIVLGNLSSVYAETGRSTEALAAAQEALKDAQDEHDPAGVVYCLSQLAGLYEQRGDLEGALRTFHQGLSWVSELGYAPLIEAEIQKDLGGLYVQVGNWEQARLVLRRSIELDAQQSDPVSLEARGLLATAMQHSGKLTEAVKEDTAAIDIARQSQLKLQQADLLLKRARLYLALHRQAMAVSDIAAASALASQLKSLPLQVETAIALGDAECDVDFEAAAASYRNAKLLATETGEREQQSEAAAGLANALQRAGRLEDAAASIEEAVKIAETARGSLSSRELQVSYFSMRRTWYELAVDICMKLDSEHPAGGYAQLAFSYTERARARSLLDSLDASGYDATIPVPGSVREAYAQNQRDVVAEQALLANDNGRNRAEITEKLQRLYSEQEGLESQMWAADDNSRLLQESRVATAEQVQQQLLDRQSAVLSYWIGNDHSYRWIVTPDRVRVDVLPPRSKLEAVVLPLEKMLQNRRPVPSAGGNISDYLASETAYEQQLQRALTRVGSLLLPDLPAGTHTLLVAADGCLRSLPFAALRVPDGAATVYALRRYSIFLEPSLSVVLHLKLHPALEQSPLITVFADPVFSPRDSRLAAALQPRTTSQDFLLAHLQRLRGSADEARTIARYALPGTVTMRTGFDASPDAVRDLSTGRASILHFATHTVAVPGNPEVTGIVLSTLDRRGREHDGIFWLRDIYALRLPLSLVVLSACNSGTSHDTVGEELSSLSYAFLFAGVHSVVGSLWSADDTTTNRLMDNFYYRLLVKQRLVPEALREAQLKMLANPQTKSPTVWASFVFEGWPAAYAYPSNVAEEHPSLPSSPLNSH